MTGMKGNWTRITAKAMPDLSALIPPEKPDKDKKDSDMKVMAMPLPFMPGVRLIRVDLKDQALSFGHYALWRNDDLYPLRGDSDVLHEARSWKEFKLDDANVVEYLTFFCLFMHTEAGPFMVVESSDDMNLTTLPQAENKIEKKQGDSWKFSELTPGQLDEIIQPPVVKFDEKKDAWKIKTYVQYGDSLFSALFKVARSGVVGMSEDELVVLEIPFNDLLLKMPEINSREIDISIHKEFIKEQLLDALRRGAAEPLYTLNKKHTDKELLKDFSSFVFRAFPCIAVESDQINCEDSVIRILGEYVSGAMKVKVAKDQQGDGVALVPNIKEGEILLLSMHKNNSILKEEWVVHHLGVTDAVAIIGCPATASLPSALKNLVDIRLTLRAPDREFVKSLFNKLTGHAWPKSVEIENESWPRYLVPADLRQLLRLQHTPSSDAIPDEQDAGQWSARLLATQLYKKVTSRFKSIVDHKVPGLDQLHGLGAATTVAQDLIGDIKAALTGSIKWSEIDRGMLIAGAPGTGKTLLAKVIAKECGIHFVPVSGANWVVETDGLGEHIKAIRATFSEARQMSPCILFIDEIDSIGNREGFNDHNRQYNVEIVNTLLQEIQGINTDRPVFVIAATNHPHNVDPALRRAGRLEQVIHISLPDRKALAGILELYMKEYIKQDNVDGQLDYSLLAAIAVGSTGADIERFVRNAARRARKEGTRITSRHLVASITGRSRTNAGLEKRCKDEVQRTAVHEAGHAIAIMSCKECPTELTMVSAVPRDDGSLGVTKMVLREHYALTRVSYLEHLEILLAGRAAEELWYGEENISSGAGGSSQSDLANATRIALDIVSKYGMGSSGHLRWVTEIDKQDSLFEVREMIADAYKRVLQKLEAQRPLLTLLQQKLLDELEITAVELDHLAKEYNLSTV